MSADFDPVMFAAGVDIAPHLQRWSEQVLLLTTMPDERLLALRQRLYFSTTLLDALLRELELPPQAAAERKKPSRMGRFLSKLGRKKHSRPFIQLNK